MKFTKTTCLLFLAFSINTFSAQLDFECDITPIPLKIDCPNDEFFSLGVYPGENTINPESYSDLYQWGADYMDFSYGWYYTLGTARLGMEDAIASNYPNELLNNIRSHSSGSFTMNSPSVNDSSITLYQDRLIHGFSKFFPSASASNHGSLTLGLINAKSDNFIGITGLCRNCSMDLVSTSYGSVNIINTAEVLVSSLPPVDNCNLIPSLSSISDLYIDSEANNYNGIDDEERLENRGVKCSQEALNLQLAPSTNALTKLISSGNQIVNLSLQYSELSKVEIRQPIRKYEFSTGNFGIGGNRIDHQFYQWQLDLMNPQRDVYPNCDSQVSKYGFKLSLCDKFETAKDRDVIIVAAAGNNLKNEMAWPASEIENVIAVAGIDPYGRLWDRRVIETDCLSPNNTNECGTNFDVNNTLFAAPGHNVLGYHPFGDYNSGARCFDNNFIADSSEGYQLCSGTSFSTTYVSSIIAMIRSINPLISFDDVKQILWDAKVEGLADQRYSVPQADKSVEITLGQSNGQQVVNRLTPMFRMVTNGSPISYLSTTIPQVAVAAKLGTYMVQPREDTGVIDATDLVRYHSDSSSPVVSGYENFKYEQPATEQAHAPFFVFGGHRNPFNNEAADLLPLHHMAKPKFTGVNGNCTLLADNAYSTNRANGLLGGNKLCDFYHLNHLYEGIDGYILPTCPTGVDCYETTGNADDAQCLKLRFSQTNKTFALMMASETNKPMFLGYGTNYTGAFNASLPITSINGLENAECMGYVFPNVDSDLDGIIDGMELILGTDPDLVDSDLDGINDGVEYPLAGIPLSDPATPLSAYFSDVDGPLNHIDFGLVKSGESSFRNITVSNLGEADLTVTGCSVDNPNFSVLGCPINIAGSSNTTEQISLSCNPSSVSNTSALLANLTLNTNDPRNPTVSYKLNCRALSSDAIFADSSEPILVGGACSLSQWDGYNLNFTTSTQLTTPRYNGLCAMQQTTAGLIQDKTPQDETRLRGRFYFYAEPTSLSTASTNLTLFSAFSNDFSFNDVFSIEFDGTQISFISNDGGINASAQVSSTNWHSVEFDWNQNGNVSLWVDSDARNVAADAIGSSGSINSVIGSIALGHPNLLGDYSRLIFDEYQSHQTTPIGRLLNSDANSDNVLSIFDYLTVYNEILGNFLSPGTPDCNEDASINISDVTCIINNISVGN